jgi:hypothetical protein
MDSKIGKNILSESITIKAKPHLKNFNGSHLSGAFEIDDEGIVPPEEVTIVENGILKNLLNDRTITHPSQAANGFSSGAGVLEITTAFKHTERDLQQKLINTAKAQGLDYALIVRHSPLLMGLVNVYKISVADGKEELFRNALLPEVNFRSIRRLLGASGSYQAHNVNQSKFMNSDDNGPETSYIVPNAILLESIDIKPFEVPTLKEEEYVSNPLLEIK